MKLKTPAARAALAPALLALMLPMAALVAAPAAQAQNIAIVNGKPVPKARLDTLLDQAKKAGQAITPELEARAKDEVVLREIFTQEALKQGIPNTADFKAQMELARQAILIRDLFDAYRAKHPITDAQALAEYDKYKAASSGTEYRARHILVDSEDQAKKLIAEIKGGAKFADVAKKYSKDTGSAPNGGELDFAKPDAYVPEFAEALTKLKKGEMTQTPVKTQFGWHIIELEDTRPVKFPEFADVKDKIKERLEQIEMQQYQEALRKAAKTDYNFGRPAAAAPASAATK
ncbi:MAG: peptidylprolyl isomerase [Burkholderiales bacterium]|nr:peptidylprolyl isomerase [Burkholderiales bacterium]